MFCLLPTLSIITYKDSYICWCSCNSSVCLNYLNSCQSELHSQENLKIVIPIGTRSNSIKIVIINNKTVSYLIAGAQ